MAQTPYRRHIRRVRRIIHERLDQHEEAQHVHELLVCRVDGLHERRAESEGGEVFGEVLVGGEEAEGETAELGLLEAGV